MAAPSRYTPTYDFETLRETADGVFPASSVDVELANIETTTDEIIDNLALIQRDDGQLKNGIVTRDSLSAELSLGFTLRGEWSTGVDYLVADGAILDDVWYRATETHTSTAANAPGEVGAPWEELTDFGAYTAAAQAAATAAAASATTAAQAEAGALVAETNAQASSSSAAASKTAAEAAEAGALVAETNAQASSSSAATSATNAANSATAAANSAAAIGAAAAKLIHEFNTRTAAIAYVPLTYNDAPNRVRTLGYGAVNDGGGAEYKKVVSQPAHALRFGMTAGDASTVWYEIASTTVDLRAAGAKFDNDVASSTVNNTAWNNVIGFINSTSYPGNTVTVLLPPGRCYIHDEPNDILAPCNFIGSGEDQTNVSFRASSAGTVNTLFTIGDAATQVLGVNISGISTDYYHQTSLSDTRPWIHLFHAKRVNVRNIQVTNCPSLVHIGDATSNGADHCRFENVSTIQYAPAGGSAVLGIDGANCKFINCTFTAGGALNSAARGIKIAPPAGSGSGVDSWKFYACEFNYLTNNVPILYEITGAGSVTSNVFHTDCLWDGGGTDTIKIHTPTGGTGTIRTVHFTGCRVTARPTGDCLLLHNETANPLTGVTWVGGSFQTITGSAIEITGTTDVEFLVEGTSFIKADNAAVPAVKISNTGGGFQMIGCNTGFNSTSFTVGYTHLVDFTGDHKRSIIANNNAADVTSTVVDYTGLAKASLLQHLVSNNLDGNGKQDMRWKVTSTGTTNAFLVDAELDDDTTYTFRATVVGNDTANTKWAGYTVQGVVYRTGGGGATLLASTTTVIGETDAVWTSLFSTAANRVLLVVSSNTGDTANWACNLEYARVA